MKLMNHFFASLLIVATAAISLNAMEQQEGGIYLTELRTESRIAKISITRMIASGDSLPTKEYVNIPGGQDYTVKPFLLLNAPVQCQGTLGQCLGGARALLSYVPEMPSGFSGWLASTAASAAQKGRLGETAQRLAETGAPLAEGAQAVKKASEQPLSTLEKYNSVPALRARVVVADKSTDIELVDFAPGFYTLVISANNDAHLERTKAKGFWGIFGCCTRRK